MNPHAILNAFVDGASYDDIARAHLTNPDHIRQIIFAQARAIGVRAIYLKYNPELIRCLIRQRQLSLFNSSSTTRRRRILRRPKPQPQHNTG